MKQFAARLPLAVLFLTFLLNGLNTFAQTTVQFSTPLPPGSKSELKVDPMYFGSYKGNNSGTSYLFDDTGIWIVSTVVAYITRDQIRESALLDERNGYLFGIKADDSIPCVQENDRYYYGLENKLLVVGAGSAHQLTRIDAKTYIINFREGDFYEPSILQFDGQKLRVIHGDLTYRPEFDKLLKIKTIIRYEAPTDILGPTAAQWTTLRSQLFTGESLNYLKEP